MCWMKGVSPFGQLALCMPTSDVVYFGGRVHIFIGQSFICMYKFLSVKGLFNDFNNNFLWCESDRKKKGKKSLVSKFVVNSNLPILRYAWLCCASHCFIDCWTNSCDKNVCWNCSYFTMKWFQMNLLSKVCF